MLILYLFCFKAHRFFLRLLVSIQMTTAVFFQVRIFVLFAIAPSFLIAAVSPSPAPIDSATMNAAANSPADSVSRPAPPVITAQATVLFNAYTGKILFKHNAIKLRPVASTQKLLTALIIAESGNLDKPVIIDKSDTLVAPTKLGVRAGEVYTRRELLTAMLVKSANDLAVTLARDNAGNVPNFVEKMNHRMRELLGTSSHFENPSGLPSDAQHSTAWDMAIVARAVYANPILRDMVNCRIYTFRFNSGKTVAIRNTNHLLLDYSFCNGMKTGYTDKAGHCLIASGNWNGKDVIAVIFGEPDRSKIWKDGRNLLIYGLGLRPEEVAAARLSKRSIAEHKHTSPASKPRKKNTHKRHS